MKIDRRTAIKTGLITGLGFFTSHKVAADCLTTTDIEGPYYLSGSSLTSKLAPSGAAGTRLFVTGTVYANDCTTPISNGVVDVWHANDGGGYEDKNYRGIIKTDASGKYAFESILPGKYLNGSQYRPRHLHYKVSAPDADTDLVLTTQIYFEGDTSIAIDPWASDASAKDRIIPLSADQNNAEHGVADFVIDIDPAKVTRAGRPNPLANTLQSIYPNPVLTEGTALLSLEHAARVDLSVFDLNGKEAVQILNGKPLTAGAHSIPFTPLNARGLKMPSGIYIMKLWVESKPVDVKRFMVS